MFFYGFLREDTNAKNGETDENVAKFPMFYETDENIAKFPMFYKTDENVAKFPMFYEADENVAKFPMFYETDKNVAKFPMFYGIPTKDPFKGTVRVLSRSPSCKYGIDRLTTIPLKALHSKPRWAHSKAKIEEYFVDNSS